MEQVTRQLERIRGRARGMLIAQRLLQWLSAVGLLVLGCGLVDYGLRLPGWLRLVVGLVALAVAGVWLVSRLRQVMGFHPALSVIALRAEKLYPQLGGVLASGVDFARQRERMGAGDDAGVGGSGETGESGGGGMRVMVDESIAMAEAQLQGVTLEKLLDSSKTLRWLMVWVATAAVLGSVVVASGGNSVLAMRRWLMPLGDAAWPRRVQLVDQVEASVWPSDTPVSLQVKVVKGYSRGMRVWADYRLVDDEGKAGKWREVLMSEQGLAGARVPEGGRGLFERLVEVNGGGRTQAVMYRFRAGDDQTRVKRLGLIARPNVERVTVTIDPPGYAAGLAAREQKVLSDQAGQVVSVAGLVGSQVTMVFELNKMVVDEGVGVMLPGFAEAVGDDGKGFIVEAVSSDAGGGARMTVGFGLGRTLSTSAVLSDDRGLANLSERVYRVEAVVDRAPAVSIIDPASDESVLHTAVLDIEAMAQDDVGLKSLAIEMAIGKGGDAAEGVEQLVKTDERGGRLSVKRELDLSVWALQAGDVVELTGVAADVYELGGSEHEVVRSTVRKLHVIDAAAMVGQIHNELAGLRQQAIRLEGSQQKLMQAEAGKAAGGQKELTRRIRTQQKLVDAIRGRMARNRLEEAALGRQLDKVEQLLAGATQASQAAAESLDLAAQHDDEKKLQQGRGEQGQTAQQLRDLAVLLDQGKDIVGLQLKLKELLTRQAGLAATSRQVLPHTLGKSMTQLSDAERAMLEQLAQRQAELAEQSQVMTRKMQATAEALERQSDKASDQAAGAALSRAAAISQGKGLSEKMRQAAQAAGANKLSQAGDQQSQSLDILQEMLKELNELDKRQREVLKRQLAQLARLIERLVKQQGEQLERLRGAAVVDPLAEPMEVLRRGTTAAAEQARGPELGEVGQMLDRAVEAQGRAIRHLRAKEKVAAVVSETAALGELEAALKLVREKQQALADDQAAEQREKLREAYLELAKQQKQIRQVSGGYVGVEKLSRRERAKVVDLGHRESDIRGEVMELGEQVQQTMVFKYLHGKIESLAADVVKKLRGGQVDAAALADQQAIERMLLTMAAALEKGETEDDFARESGGGEGGGGGGQPPVVPPVAELKALRVMQQGIYEQTRALGDEGAAAARQVMELSGRQRELTGLGERLIEKMKQQQAMQQRMAPGGGGGDDDGKEVE